MVAVTTGMSCSTLLALSLPKHGLEHALSGSKMCHCVLA